MRHPLEVARFRAEIVDLANVGVQREPDRNTDEKFCRFTPETFAWANVSQVLSESWYDRA